jgi:hypothetical protein
MKKKTQELLDTSLAVLVFAGVFGVGIWRVVRRRPPAAKIAEPEPHSDREPQLESLSLNTPGDAPLDRLARLAARNGYSELPLAPEHRSAGDLLEHQSLASAPLEGWSVPEPARLPIPTYAPAIMALGIVLFAMGLATVWYVCVVGSLVFTIAAWRWTGELQGE